MFETSCRGLASFYRALSSFFFCPFISLFYSSSFLSPFFSSISIFTTYAFLIFFLFANYYRRNNINRNNQVCELIFFNLARDIYLFLSLIKSFRNLFNQYPIFIYSRRQSLSLSLSLSKFCILHLYIDGNRD